MTSSMAMALLVLVPLATAALSFVWPRAGRWLGLVTPLLLAIALWELTGHLLREGTQTTAVGGWRAPLGIELRADGLALLLLLVTLIVGSVVSLYAQHYFRLHAPAGTAAATAVAGDRRARYFWPLLLFLWTALDALFLSADVFNLYVTLELLGLAAVALVALAGKRAALEAAMRYLFVTLSASLFFLLGVGLCYAQYATVDLSLLGEQMRANPPSWIAAALMSAGLLAKAALFPLHFWLPPAHANAPAPVSALLSALVVKGSFYILLRLWLEAFAPMLSPAIAQLFGLLGAAAILWGSLNALAQARLKLLVAYSTVAQLGYLFLALPLIAAPAHGFTAYSGALIFLAAHAGAKTAMFLVAGNVLLAVGHDRIRDLDGITQRLPLSMFTFALSGMSLVGLPPSGGFAGKWLLLRAAIDQGQWWWAAVMLAGSLLAAAYCLRVLTHAFTNVAETRVTCPVPRSMQWSALGLALVVVGAGLAARWPVALLAGDSTGPW